MKIKFTGPNGQAMPMQGWSASHTSSDCTAQASIHIDNKVAALIVAHGEYDDVIPRIKKIGKEIERRFVAHDRLVKALSFYAKQQHFHMHEPDAWDTVSGEPPNFYEDESNTATVEDGSIAKLALAEAGVVL